MARALGPWVLWTGGWRKWLNCGKHVHTECKAVCKCPLPNGHVFMRAAGVRNFGGRPVLHTQNATPTTGGLKKPRTGPRKLDRGWI